MKTGESAKRKCARVQSKLSELGCIHDVVELPDSTRTAQEAADAIGCQIAPLAHIRSIATIVDEDLFQFKTIWAAAGHPKAVFELAPDELLEMTRGRVMSIK